MMQADILRVYNQADTMATETRPVKDLSFRERKIQRRSITRSLLSITPENSSSQLASPLFSVLPAELRNQIFALVCSQYRDTSCVIDLRGIQPRVCRPSHQHPVRTCTSLLRTCRLIYYETRVIPLQSATHYVYTARDWPYYVFHFTRAQQVNLYHLHVSFTPSLERNFEFLDRFTRGDGTFWKKITISKNWHTSLPELWAHPEEIWQIHAFPIQVPLSCSELVFEVEVLKDPQPMSVGRYQGMAEAEEYVQWLRTYEVLRIDESSFAKAASRVERFSWTAPNNSKRHTKGWRAIDPKKPTVECEVYRVVWKGVATFS
ncbi:hypothetical protein BU16DRAFT_396155 [Lophium mytilinum]|uniref:F-box domain-containing protein n=1 Tax=Lophium mytilinum TaxID=390894 RepID=A0A6A6QT14_9PEZI|nr:hypothetical protein BU16DRAFT_396155 [Lophium mytilinum]